MKKIILITILILLCSFATAIEIKDINTNEPINNITVYYTIDGQTSSQFVEDSLILKKNAEIIIKGYYPETPSIDYYIKTEIDKDTDLVYLTPVGTLRGVVYDRLNNVVNKAELKFECTFETEFPKTTDKFGSFDIEFIPTGNCKIHAISKDYIGTQEIEITQGSINSIEIILDTNVMYSNPLVFPLIILIIIAIIAVIIFFVVRRKLAKKEPKPVKSNKRINDITTTLSTKEKQIVNLLLENHNELSQALIRHNTGIARTTLSRILESLESKNIINIERMGKLVKVRLTPWLLGKDKKGKK